MQQLSQALHEKKGNPKNSAGLKKTEGTSSLRLFSKRSFFNTQKKKPAYVRRKKYEARIEAELLSKGNGLEEITSAFHENQTVKTKNCD